MEGNRREHHKLFDPSFRTLIYYTEYAGHAIELANDAAKTCDAVIAVGGDGMMNEVARGIINTNAALGI